MQRAECYMCVHARSMLACTVQRPISACVQESAHACSMQRALNARATCSQRSILAFAYHMRRAEHVQHESRHTREGGRWARGERPETVVHSRRASFRERAACKRTYGGIRHVRRTSSKRSPADKQHAERQPRRHTAPADPEARRSRSHPPTGRLCKRATGMLRSSVPTVRVSSRGEPNPARSFRSGRRPQSIPNLGEVLKKSHWDYRASESLGKWLRRQLRLQHAAAGTRVTQGPGDGLIRERGVEDL